MKVIIEATHLYYLKNHSHYIFIIDTESPCQYYFLQHNRAFYDVTCKPKETGKILPLVLNL